MTGRERTADDVGAFVVGPEVAVQGAPAGPAAGLTFAVKDVIDVAGRVTGAGNPTWAATHDPAATHAPVVHALLASGMDLVGVTVCDELAFGLDGENVHHGTPRNPAAPGRLPGGSSSGSAVAVAASLVDVALGTDTAGSIRVPASYCGLVGIRPTHGRLSTRGLVPLAPSFDTVGTFARDGTALRTAWRAVAGPPTRQPPLRRILIADDLVALADPGVADAAVDATEAVAARLGVGVEHVQLCGPDGVEACRDVFRALQLVEVWAAHGGWISEHEPALGARVRQRFERASRAQQADADAAAGVREGLEQMVAELLGDDGVIVHPTAPEVAPPPDPNAPGDDPRRARTLAFTAPASLLGLPVVSLPLAGLDGRPVGVALTGPRGADDRLVEIAASLVPGAPDPR